MNCEICAALIRCTVHFVLYRLTRVIAIPRPHYAAESVNASYTIMTYSGRDLKSPPANLFEQNYYMYRVRAYLKEKYATCADTSEYSHRRTPINSAVHTHLGCDPVTHQIFHSEQ